MSELGSKITALTAISTVENTDVLVGVDVSDTTAGASGTNKKFTKSSLLSTIDAPTMTGEQKFFPRSTPTGLVTFYFDDGADEGYTVLKPIFEAQGEVCALGLVSGTERRQVPGVS